MANINKKTLMWVGAGLATTIIGYFIIDLLKTKRDAIRYSAPQDKKVDDKKVDDKKVKLGDNEIGSNKAQPSSDAYPLKIGSYGAKVHVLQQALNKLGAGLTVDGKFGQQTHKAVYNVPYGFGGLNLMCGVGYNCEVTYNNWQNIIKKAQDQGLNLDQAWTNAKTKWQV